MKHAILGTGAVGGLVGTALASLGEDVIVIVRPEKLPSYPERLTLERPSGTITAPARAVAELAEAVDVLWISTRTFQLQSVLPLVHSTPNMIVPLLNGVEHITTLRARFGHDRVVPATIAVEAERTAPGHFVQRSPFVRLNLAASAEPALGGIITQMGEIGFHCQFVADESTLLWGKLCFLAPIALACSASGLDKGGVFADPKWKGKLFAVVEEACHVANAEGAKVEVDAIKGLIEGVVPALRPSMQKDIAAKRPLELDAIAGPIVRDGERHGIKVPTTRELMARINAIIA